MFVLCLIYCLSVHPVILSVYHLSVCVRALLFLLFFPEHLLFQAEQKLKSAKQHLKLKKNGNNVCYKQKSKFQKTEARKQTSDAVAES